MLFLNNYYLMVTLFSLESTIFAWATALDGAARAVLRVSGSETFGVLGKLFSPDDEIAPHRTAPGFLWLADDLKVRAWVWRFPGPRSYTGQDMAEIHTIGSPPVQKLIDQRLLQAGLTPARPGEFSARAFLLGKMDLTQAEAVNQLIEAGNDAQIQAALNLLHGHLHRRLISLYQELSELATALEANIDFSEEEIETVTLDQVVKKLDDLEQTVGRILSEAIDVRALRELPRVFLAGPANSGKSTLLNRLAGLDRAMCSPLPGTTRDILTAVWPSADREVLLCDTPGLLNTPSDEVTRAAVERTKQILSLADLLILVLDAAADLRGQLQLCDALDVNNNKTLIALNKTDIIGKRELEKRVTELERDSNRRGMNIFPISAWEGAGLPELTAAAFDRLGAAALTTAGNRIALDLRGRAILEAARGGLQQAMHSARMLMGNRGDGTLGLETVAADVLQTLRALGPLLGKDVTKDVFDNIFSKFCIGK